MDGRLRLKSKRVIQNISLKARGCDEDHELLFIFMSKLLISPYIWFFSVFQQSTKDYVIQQIYKKFNGWNHTENYAHASSRLAVRVKTHNDTKVEEHMS